jgi:hypothetical protein
LQARLFRIGRVVKLYKALKKGFIGAYADGTPWWTVGGALFSTSKPSPISGGMTTGAGTGGVLTATGTVRRNIGTSATATATSTEAGGESAMVTASNRGFGLFALGMAPTYYHCNGSIWCNLCYRRLYGV